MICKTRKFNPGCNILECLFQKTILCVYIWVYIFTLQLKLTNYLLQFQETAYFHYDGALCFVSFHSVSENFHFSIFHPGRRKTFQLPQVVGCD